MNRLALLILIAALLGGCAPSPSTNSATAKPEATAKGEAHADEPGHDADAHGEAGHEEGHEEGVVHLTEEAQKLAGIETLPVGFAQIQESLRVPGTVSSTETGKAVVTPPVAGTVTEITARLGQVVTAGQALAIVESPELAQAWSAIADATRLRDAAKSDLEQSHSEVKLAVAKVAAARGNLNRQRELAKAGAFSQAPVQLAQNELNDAQSELLSIQKEQASHAEQLRRLENLFRDGIVSKSELEAARLELHQDQIRLDRAKAKIENVRADYDRERNIASRGLLNAKELQSAEADVKSSSLEVDRARIRVRAAESALENANRSIDSAREVYRSNRGSGPATVGQVLLVAPISGTITHVAVTKGQAVDRTQALLEIENLNAVWVTASVPEANSGKVKTGAKARVTVASEPGREYVGIVQLIGSRVDPKSRSIVVQCLIPGAGGRLRPNTFATVHLAVGTRRRELVIPTSAVISKGGKFFVFRKVGDEFTRTEVGLGEREAHQVAVESGLTAGDLVASKGAFVLASEEKKGELKGHEH